ncbi:MAG: SGNH/GDSL hydrolase family protein [Aggregatilineales bacterium]
MKIVFLGDSLTWGGYGGNFVAHIVEQMLEHEIINAGVGGDTVVNLLGRLDNVIETHEPDMMFVMVGGNDAVSYSQPAVRAYYSRTKKLGDQMVDPETFRSTYRTLLNQLQVNHIETFVGLAPTEYNAELVELRKVYNDIARETAEKLRIPVLDLATDYTPKNPIDREAVTLKFIQEIGKRGASGWQDYEAERAKSGYTYSFDGMHLMPETAEAFGNRITQFLKKHIS